MEILDKCLNTSQEVLNKRDIKDVVIKLMEEVGEIAQEISKLSISKYKLDFNQSETTTVDRTISECGDAIICLTDLVYLLTNCNKEEAKTVLNDKILLGLDKWKVKYNNIKS